MRHLRATLLIGGGVFAAVWTLQTAGWFAPWDGALYTFTGLAGRSDRFPAGVLAGLCLVLALAVVWTTIDIPNPSLKAVVAGSTLLQLAAFVGVAALFGARVLDGMLQIEQSAYLFTGVMGINQDRSLPQQAAITFQNQVRHRVHERVPWADELCHRLPGQVDGLFVERDALVARQYGTAQLPAAVADDGRHMGNLPA